MSDFSSAEEYHRFSNLPPIRQEEVEGVDWDQLAARFQQDE